MTPNYWSKKVDANQADIVDCLRAAGFTVVPIHRIGQGVPDLLVGYQGVNVLLEVKDGDKLLTDDELKWHANWCGQVDIVRSSEGAMRAVLLATWRVKNT